MLQAVAHTLRFPKTCCRKSSTASVCSWQEMQLLASRDLRDLRNVSTSGRVVWHRWYQDNKYHGKQARIWMYMTCRVVQNRGRGMAIHGSYTYIVQCKQSCIAWLTGLLRMDPMLNWNYTRTHLLLPSESAFQLGRASASFCATVRHAPSNHLISVHTSEPEIYSRKVKVWAMNCISSIVILRQISVSDPTTCFHIS